MTVYLMIRRHRTTILTDAKESTYVNQLKMEVAGLLKVAPADIRLYKDGEVMDVGNTLKFYGYTSETTKPLEPGLIGVTLKTESGEFVELDITPYSTPLEFLEYMKCD